MRQVLIALCALTMMTTGCRPTASGSLGVISNGQSGGKPGAASYVNATPLSSQTTTYTVPDPSFNNMPATVQTIPAGWRAQGIILTTACTSEPYAVFRAYSPDGLMQMRYEPVFGWVWRPNYKGVNTTGCIPVTQQMTAAQFLQYYVNTMPGGVHVVGTMPVPPAYQQQWQSYASQVNAVYSRAAGNLSSTVTADTAALRIETIDGSYVIEERLRTVVVCTLNNNPGIMYGGTCFSRVDELTAPEGRLDALVAVVDGANMPNAQPLPQWEQAVLARQRQQAQAQMAMLHQVQMAEENALNSEFRQFSNMMNANHAAAMQQQESQFQSAMANANAQMNAQSTAASDWVDYALDQQTVTGPGGTVNVSSAYSQTWTNGTQYYQTNDPNVNPNGVLAGQWTLTTPTHGNGTPM
jgi:hypothetical protein